MMDRIMALPPLYKYFDARGAKLTLGNGRFRHAKPSDFNDIEDFTIRSLFSEPLEEAGRISQNFHEILYENRHREIRADNATLRKAAVIQHAFRVILDAIRVLREELVNVDEVALELDRMSAFAQAQVDDLNRQLQGYRALYVTTEFNSKYMWDNYAAKNTGAMVRISPLYEKDSKFKLFKPVKYSERHPSLYDHADQFVFDALFGDRENTMSEILDRAIYSKTNEWKFESEYRLAIPIFEHEEAWDTLPFHPEEVDQLYLGHAMTAADAEEIIAKAIRLNPAIEIYRPNANGNGDFNRV